MSKNQTLVKLVVFILLVGVLSLSTAFSLKTKENLLITAGNFLVLMVVGFFLVSSLKRKV